MRVQGATEDNNERETQARTLTAQAASAQRQADKLSEAHLRALAERDAARRERDDSRALLAQLGYAPAVLCSRFWFWFWFCFCFAFPHLLWRRAGRDRAVQAGGKAMQTRGRRVQPQRVR